MTDTAQLIHDLEHADAETCYEAVRRFVIGATESEFLLQTDLLAIISLAEAMKKPDLLLGVVAALRPERWAYYAHWIGVDAHQAAAELWLPAQRTEGLLKERFRCEAQNPACALAAAILRSRGDDR